MTPTDGLLEKPLYLIIDASITGGTLPMKRSKIMGATLVATLGLMISTVPGYAADAAQVTCKDGTASKAGRGACRGHGGVQKGAEAATAPAQNDKAMAPAAMSADKPMVNCKDGSSSKGGRGACRGHGGIAKDGETAAKAMAPAATAAAAPVAAATAKATTVSAKSAAPAAAAATGSGTMGSGAGVSSDPTGATAQCKDGSYSHSKSHRGACSRHGGVGKWL
jgi:Protein of unknown function (DUF3761)